MADPTASKLDDARTWWRRHPVIIAVAAVAIVALLAWHFWPASSGDAASGGADKAAKGQGKGGAKSGGAGKFGGGGDPNRPQPVSVATAQVGRPQHRADRRSAP